MCFLGTMCFERIKATLVSVGGKKKQKASLCADSKVCSPEGTCRWSCAMGEDGAGCLPSSGAAHPGSWHWTPSSCPFHSLSPEIRTYTLLVSYARCTHTKHGLCVFALTSSVLGAPGSQSEAKLTTELHPRLTLLKSLLLHLAICVWVCSCAHICAVAPVWKSECTF